MNFFNIIKIILLSLLILYIYSNVYNNNFNEYMVDVDIEEQEQNTDDFSYRDINYYQGIYEEPEYYDPDTNYDNIINNFKKPMHITNHKLLNWGDIENDLLKKQINYDNMLNIDRSMSINMEDIK